MSIKNAEWVEKYHNEQYKAMFNETKDLGEATFKFLEPGERVEDNVNNPSHYNESGIECIEAIKATLGDGYQDYCKGNVMKYLWRYKYKNGIEDLKKAQWYLNSMVESME